MPSSNPSAVTLVMLISMVRVGVRSVVMVYLLVRGAPATGRLGVVGARPGGEAGLRGGRAGWLLDQRFVAEFVWVVPVAVPVPDFARLVETVEIGLVGELTIAGYPDPAVAVI